ncbi:unnamed protein product [Strongylus vulgaris]|uniref:Uncharacterized protein n=1 Tax=Strongylus vulgaris TaxID=40348 RepID=A0A3P7IWM4_STRVU|nr:unnamed protein product [Strongylus vulgaris]
MSSADPATVEFGRRLERESEENRISSEDEGTNTGRIFSTFTFSIYIIVSIFTFFCLLSLWPILLGAHFFHIIHYL